MSEPRTSTAPAALWTTDRHDNWWLGPLLTFMGLSAFVVYATVRAFWGKDFEVEAQGLLSPFYSPNLKAFAPSLFPSWVSPALLILWAPGGFRLTCYYYRKAYYRSFVQHPTACAVSEGRHGDYKGESAFPLILQNFHRYLLYAACFFLIFLWHDVWKALWPEGKFGLTLGTIVLAANTTLLTFYTLSCHSLRHLVGGKLDCFSCDSFSRARYQAWGKLSILNASHMLWAWTSLFCVAFADFYVWMVASGTFSNPRIF